MPSIKMTDGSMKYINIQTQKTLQIRSFEGFDKNNPITRVRILGPHMGLHGDIHVPLSELEKMISELRQEVSNG